MLARWIKKFVLATVCVSAFTSTAMAGEITGVVKQKNGKLPASGVRILGMTSGLFCGATKTVYTDRNGKFVLTWTSSNGLKRLYVNGSTVASNIRNGESIELILK